MDFSITPNEHCTVKGLVRVQGLELEGGRFRAHDAIQRATTSSIPE